MALVGEVAGERRLGQALADLESDYDLIVIDAAEPRNAHG